LGGKKWIFEIHRAPRIRVKAEIKMQCGASGWERLFAT